MDRTPKLRRAPLVLLIVAVLALAAGIGVSCCQAASTPSGTSALIRVGAGVTGPAVPSGFVGISMEYRGLEAYAGDVPTAIDAPFEQLLRNLAPKGGFVLRIGGDSTDWTWWPVPGLAPPGGVRYSLSPTWAAVAKTLVGALSGHMLLGINFESDSRRVAAFEAGALLSHVGRSLIQGFELGNEPELYASFPWYKNSAGHHIYGRVAGYSPSSMIGDFANIASALPAAPIAGPSTGAPLWLGSIGQFAAAERRVGLVTIHAYPLKHCNPHVFAAPTDLFGTPALQGLADEIGGWVRAVGAHQRPLRVDEMNSISCGGQRGLSQAFAPALWALDMLPRVLRTGAQGVNFHTVPNANNALISATESHGAWRVSVQPEYYGLLAFAQAAPAGARLLSVSASPDPGLDEWATRAPNGQIHVVLINTTGGPQSPAVSVAGASGPATLGLLRAPGLTATSGVTLGGEGISPTTGSLAGSSTVVAIDPVHGEYRAHVPPWSAAVLTLG